MRAGRYAEFGGVLCRAVGATEPLRLYALAEPAPPGFTLDRRGRWTLLVGLDQLTRLFDVQTTATWRGHSVRISYVDGGLAQFTYFGMGLPEAPGVRRVQSDEWQGTVPVDELSDIVEVVDEIPV
ncbi:hypothetical protein [Cellulomonas sp.]|uniref:hypothetical protein n=1 Tax=Cellulomonas sp. TaxID=40001 RepID=UPI003BACE211